MSAMPDALAAPAVASPEDQARADFYALLARLYLDAPDAALLTAIASAQALSSEGAAGSEGVVGLPAAWDALREASAVANARSTREEYDLLFVGVGRSEVNLHASHWLTGFMMEKPLVEVRAALAAMGLTRREGIIVVEDHIAPLFETMRLLVAGNDNRPPATLAEQKAFHDRHIAPWIGRCCTAIVQSPVANYYRRVAQLTDSYMAVERDSLAME